MKIGDTILRRTTIQSPKKPRQAAESSPVIDSLNKVLANAVVLSQKVHGFHWNVLSANFFDLHQEFAALYDMLNEDIDAFAERIRQLQAFPVHTLAEFVALSDIEEDKGFPNWKDMCTVTVDDFTRLTDSMVACIKVAEEAGDRPTVFCMDTKVGVYQKHQWFLRSFVAGE